MAHKGTIPKDILVELYKTQGLTMKEVGTILGRTASNIHYWAHLYGIEPNPRTSINAGYTVNERFFDTWSPSMAWVLGLIYADGHVSTNAGNKKWVLSSKDHGLLEQVAHLLDWHGPIAQYKGQTTPGLCVGKAYMVHRLQEFGLTSNKSRTALFPTVPAGCLSHFCRGLWDGDGCIFVRDRTRKSTTQGLRNRKYTRRGEPHTFTYTYREITTSYVGGSRSLVISLRDHLSSSVPEIRHAPVRQRQEQYNPYYVLEYYHRDSIRLIAWLYSSSTPITRLSRKHELASEFLAQEGQA